MTGLASVAAAPRSFVPARGTRGLLAALFLLAIVAGALASTKPTYSIALVGAAIVGLIVARKVGALPYFLVFTMFVESVSLGPGLRIGRVFGGLAILVLVLTLLTRGRGGLRPSALLATAGGYGIWILASALWAWSPGAVGNVVFSYILSAAYALTFAVLVRSRAQLVGIGRVLAIGSAIFGAIAFVYYARHSGAASAAAINDAGNRASGLQGDPNYFAVFQVIALPTALVLGVTERGRRLRLVYYAVVGLIVISVISSLSRTGLIALTVAILLTVAMPWRIFFAAPRQKVSYLLAILAGAGVAVAIGSTRLVARVQTILDPNAQGSYRGAGREDLWNAALHGWREGNRLLGIGAGNFAAHSLDLLQSTPGVDTTQNYIGPNRPVHNAYLENLTELGLIGLALFVLLLLFTGRSLLHSFRRARAAGDLDLQRFSLAFLVSLVAYALSAMFLSNQLAKALWILVGLALALEVMTRRSVRLAAAPYDAAVRPAGPDETERELAAIRQRLVADQERLDRRRAALDERERELEQRAGQPTADRGPGPGPQVAALEKLLRSRDGTIAALREELAELQQAGPAAPDLAPRVAALEKLLRSREGTIAELRAQLEEARAQPVAPPKPEPEPEPELELVPEPEPLPEPVPDFEPRPSRWRLAAIEQAMARHPDDPAADEWAAYVIFLRDHVEADGLLPATFDSLVTEVYGDLIARVRAGA